MSESEDRLMRELAECRRRGVPWRNAKMPPCEPDGYIEALVEHVENDIRPDPDPWRKLRRVNCFNRRRRRRCIR